MTYRKWP